MEEIRVTFLQKCKAIQSWQSKCLVNCLFCQHRSWFTTSPYTALLLDPVSAQRVRREGNRPFVILPCTHSKLRFNPCCSLYCVINSSSQKQTGLTIKELSLYFDAIVPLISYYCTGHSLCNFVYNLMHM